MDKKQKMKLPNSAKKHIRIEKARIRREFLSLEEQKEQIRKVYQKFEYMFPKPKTEPKKADKKIKIQKESIKKVKVKKAPAEQLKTTKTNTKKTDKAKRKTIKNR